MTNLNPAVIAPLINNNKQPAALPVLFFAEMWERFGFYIVQGLLVLYLTQALGWSDDKSYTVSGAFTALVYISPLIGGYIADKILGFKMTIIGGGILLAIGYALLALLAHGNETFLYFALAVVIVGNGFFKPNIGSLLGTFYNADDTRREAGFTFFYMGINLGSMLATLSSGFVKDAFGWWAGFALASAGLILGTINFLIGSKRLIGHGDAPAKVVTASPLLNWLHSKSAVVTGTLVSIPLITFLLQEKGVAAILLSVAAVLIVISLVKLAYKQPTLLARHRQLSLIFLTLIAVVFWAIFFQIFFSLNLFVERSIDRHLFGMEIPAVALISFEAMFIVILSPIFASFWQKLDARGKNPSTPMKFCLAFVLVAIGFFLLWLSTHFHNAEGLISLWWIPVSYLLITIGELLLSPIGLSAVTLLAPPQAVGMMMGVFLIAIGYGGKLAGVIAQIASIPEGITDKIVESHYYGNAFITYATLSIVVAFLVLLFVPSLKRLMRD